MCLPEIALTLGMAYRVPELASDIRIDPISFLLDYHPFHEKHQDLVEPLFTDTSN